MKDIFKNLLNTKGVEGVIYFDTSGQILFNDFKPEIKEKLNSNTDVPDWPAILEQLGGQAKEADIIFENRRIYLKKTNTGFLFVLLTINASCAMIRLLSEIMLPELQKIKKAKGLGRFFKKK